jgi:hypothetical protein
LVAFVTLSVLAIAWGTAGAGFSALVKHGVQRPHSWSLQPATRLVSHNPDDSVDKHGSYRVHPSHWDPGPQLSPHPAMKGNALHVMHFAQPFSWSN